MEQIAWIVIGVLAILLCVAIGYLHLYRKQLRNFTKQIQFVKEQETNWKLFTQISHRQVQELSDAINALLEKHRETELKLRRTTTHFRYTITNLSHDLRTPLTSADGYLQMLQKEGLSPAQRVKYLQIVSERLGEVERLMEQLFEFARIETEELELEAKPLNLNNVFRDALSLYYDDFVQHGAEPAVLIAEEDFRIKADYESIKRVFSNIIYNALIHGTGSYLFTSRKKHENYQFVFQNCTQTIEASDIAYLFERFYTTDQSRTKKTTGLGLSIAKRLVERMGGAIAATLDGDIFCITVSFPIE